MFSGVLLIISLVSVERAAANDSSTPNSAQNGNNNEFGNQLLKFQHQSCLAPLTNLNMHVPLFSPHIPSLPQSLIYTVISRVYSTSSCSPFQLPDELWIHHQPDNTLWLHGFQCSVTTLIFPLFYFIYLPITFSQELWEDTEHAELSGVQGQLPHCRWLSDHTVIKKKNSSAYCRRVFQMNFCFYKSNLYSDFSCLSKKIYSILLLGNFLK